MTSNEGLVKHATKSPEGTVNPRYLAYCAAHGNTVEQQKEADRAAWPGGAGVGFSLWIDERVRAFAAEHPEATICHRVSDHLAFDRFLGIERRKGWLVRLERRTGKGAAVWMCPDCGSCYTSERSDGSTRGGDVPQCNGHGIGDCPCAGM